MNNEIKEINIPENVLVALGDLTNGALNYYKATETVKVKHNIILDYITNLQEENKRLKAQNTRYEVKMNNLIQENNVLKENAEHNDKVVDKAKWSEMIYKSRNKKAINYIRMYYYEDLYDDTLTAFEDKLLNILQGSDKDE